MEHRPFIYSLRFIRILWRRDLHPRSTFRSAHIRLTPETDAGKLAELNSTKHVLPYMIIFTKNLQLFFEQMSEIAFLLSV